MSDLSYAPRDVRPRVIGALRLRRVQLVVAAIVALVLIVFTAIDSESWVSPWMWLSAIGMVVATVLAVFARKASGATMAIIVPTLDLLAFGALIADPQAPRIVAILAVMPAFWLGVTIRRWGIGIVAVAGVLLAIVMTLRAFESEGVTLTANAVGAVLVPLALVATAWFAYNYSHTIERQQLAILQREREKTELAKQQQADAHLLDAIFETARVGLVLLDPDGQVVRVNPTLMQHPAIAGDSLTSLLGDAQFLELETRRPILSADAPFVRAARGEAFDNMVFWISRADQDPFAVTMSSRPIMIDGGFRGSIASVDDVTTYMRMLEDRDDFVALVSHELRTPLTSITGFLELALDEELSVSLRSWLSIMQRNTDRLRALVEDLLLVGEMSRGDVHLQTERTDLRELARNAVATLEHRAQRRGVTLRLVEGPAVHVAADPRRITQVIENLIGNGIKYTRDDGNVEVRIGLDGADAVARVTDDGPGVPPVEALRVFERFYRSTEARASGVQGAGLGLWICRMIVEEHGGRIDFTSEQGAGSTASFSLPFAT